MVSDFRLPTSGSCVVVLVERLYCGDTGDGDVDIDGGVVVERRSVDLILQ
jgi:hypothetical protein